MLFQSVWIIITLNHLLIVVKSAVDTEEKDVHKDDYMSVISLISDIQMYHKVTSVIVICNEKTSSKNSTELLDLIRSFSNRNVMSMSISYADFTKYNELSNSRQVKPLFVAILDSISDMLTLQKLTKVQEMSYGLWLVLFNSPMSRQCHNPPGNIFNVAFNTEMMVKCRGDTVVREWYSLFEDETLIDEIGRWDNVNRFQLKTSRSLYNRRMNMHQVKIRIVIIKESPFVSRTDGFDGLFAHILNEMKSALNFTYEIVYEEQFYGSLNGTTKQWSGAVGRLMNGEADLGVGDFTMTEERLNVVEFTLPILTAKSSLYMKITESSNLQWSAYFNVYGTNVWFVIAAVYILSSLVITFLRVKIKEKPISLNHVSENYLSVLGIYCQQSLPGFPNASSLKIAYLSILFESVIIYATYSACLISYLTFSSNVVMFDDISDFLKDGSHQLLTLPESSDRDFFAKAASPILHDMNKLLPDPKLLPRTRRIAFEQTCKDKQIAFYTNEMIYSVMENKLTCHLFALKTGRIDNACMILAKKSPYKDILNFYLQKFKSTGLMDHLIKKSTKKYNRSDKFNPVNVNNVVSILLMLGVGMSSSATILIFEMIAYGYYSRRTKTISDNFDSQSFKSFQKCYLRNLILSGDHDSTVYSEPTLITRVSWDTISHKK